MSEVCVIIPALNEEESIGFVLNELPRELVSSVIVVDNGSTDKTAAIAQSCGCTVLYEPYKGYGAACLKGLNHLSQSGSTPDIVAFMDADYSDSPMELVQLVHPILNGDYDIIIGSRIEKRLSGSLTIPQLFGNWLATSLISLLYKVRYTDLGPFRAVRYSKLLELNMSDKTFGWTVEMQIKAAKRQFKYGEISVSYKPRIGKSKISGTVKGTVMAGYKILSTIIKNY